MSKLAKSLPKPLQLTVALGLGACAVGLQLKVMGEYNAALDSKTTDDLLVDEYRERRARMIAQREQTDKQNAKQT